MLKMKPLGTSIRHMNTLHLDKNSSSRSLLSTHYLVSTFSITPPSLCPQPCRRRHITPPLRRILIIHIIILRVFIIQTHVSRCSFNTNSTRSRRVTKHSLVLLKILYHSSHPCITVPVESFTPNTTFLPFPVSEIHALSLSVA